LAANDQRNFRHATFLLAQDREKIQQVGCESASLKLAIERGWLELHESGTHVKFTAAGADLFA